VVVEDHMRTGGLSSIVAEVALQHRTTGRVNHISFPDRWFTPGRLASVLAHERLDAGAIAGRIRTELLGVDA
jgi:transketolase C-terminal domain/subunit